MTTLLLADDHPLYRDAIKSALSVVMPDCQCLEAGDLNSTIALLESNDVDLLLLDLHMPGSQSLFGLLQIRKLFPELPVAVVSGTDNHTVVTKILAAGALGFIPKTTQSAEIAQAIKTILEGEIWLPDSYRDNVEAIDEEFSQLAEKIASLTPSQYKVLCYLREGLLNKQIGYNLEIAEATVKAHITAIFKKLGINNRTQAVLIASQLELEPPSS